MSRTVICTAGFLLLAAAGLKANQLATEPVVGAGLLGSRWFLIAAVEFELFFGIWLLSGILPKPTWHAALACFGFFTCISLYKAISGHASCGCFGDVPINPWYAAILDLAIVVSFLRWPPKKQESALTIHFKELRPRTLAVLVIWLIVGLPAALAMSKYAATTISNAGNIMGAGKIVVVEPDKWIGKRFPLLNYIDIGEQLRKGKWLVLLYHHDCSKCMQEIENLSRDVSRKGGEGRVALIELPPYGEAELLVASQMDFAHGRLNDAWIWFAATPTKVWLSDGQVMAAFLTADYMPSIKSYVSILPSMRRFVSMRGRFRLAATFLLSPRKEGA